jgi:hypothetical protein
MGREVTFKLRHYRKMMVHFPAPKSRLRPDSGRPGVPHSQLFSTSFRALAGALIAGLKGLATGADCDPAKKAMFHS